MPKIQRLYDRYYSEVYLAVMFCLVLLSGACSGIGPSTETIEKAVAVNEAQSRVFTAQAEAFRLVVSRATMEQSTRDKILDAISEDVAAFESANDAVRDYLAAFGELTPDDIDRALDRALDLYLAIDRPEDRGSSSGR